MKKIISVGLVALIAVAVWMGFNTKEGQEVVNKISDDVPAVVGEATLEVGETAPNFTLPSSEGEQVTLTDFEGSIVVLEWFNKDCPFVRKHYDTNNMQNMQEELTEDGAVVWLSIISSAPGKQGYQTPAAARITTEAEDAFPSHVLLDTEGRVGKMYDAKTTPHMFVIDEQGTLAYAGAIDSKPTAEKDDVEDAINYVKGAVNELMRGEPVSTPRTIPYGCNIKY